MMLSSMILRISGAFRQSFALLTLVTLLFGSSLYQSADAWSLPHIKRHKSAAGKKTTAKKPAKSVGKAVNPKPTATKSTSPDSPPPPAGEAAAKSTENKAAEAKKETLKDDSKVDGKAGVSKTTIASTAPTAFAAMAIEDGAATQAAKQVIERQYHFRNAFISRPTQGLPPQQIQLVSQYIQNYNKKVASRDAQTFAEAIVYFCQFYQVNPKLVAGMIAVESSFRTDAVSSSGAIGLGQLKPDTANWLSVSDPYDPIENIGGMTRYIAWLVRKYNGSYDHAVSAYYQGPGSVDRNGITEVCLPYLYKVNGALARFQ